MEQKILFLECASGISGDMFVASMLDLGANVEKLDTVLKSLKLDGYRYAISRKLSYGMDGCDFDVILEDTHTHEHAHAHEHEHTHDHHSAHHHHHHEHRNLSDVYAIIDRGEMSDRARDLAKRIFHIVAEAEAKAHGKPINEVHFHEVGAIDSIIDTVAAAVCVDDLGITECVVKGLDEGTGTVRCQHGDLPIPVPAVAAIASAHSIPLRINPAVKGERVTPTGIAIAAALRTQKGLPEIFTINRIGIGLGKRDFGVPNMLRSMILEQQIDEGRIWVLESNIDDCTGEQLGYALEKLMEAGAKDVHYVPCLMKKSRPAYLLRVVVAESDIATIEETIFRTTTTIGLRKYPVERTCLERSSLQVELPCGTVSVKRCAWQGGHFDYPEFESVKQVAETSGVDFQTVFQQAVAHAYPQKMG